MKSDQEITDWIDSKEVLTKNELNKFIYGYHAGDKPRVARHWLYVIKTKDLMKLKQYAYDKERHTHDINPTLERVRGIYRTDPRFNSIGGKSAYKLFKKLYGIDCTVGTFKKYHRQVKNV